ncbi:MAG: serine hydrolase domain-containing protein [Bacteroidota bacterium]
MKPTLPLFILALCVYTLSFAQLPDALQAQLEEVLTNIHDQSGAIGLSVAIHSSNGEWASTAGYSSMVEELTNSHPFAMGSVSKTIISAVILDMEEEGLLRLNDPIADYIDEFEYVNPDITIRQLLNHTSGIYNYTQHPSFFGDVFDDPSNIIEPETILDTYVNSPFFEPGVAWSYSNTNYVVLGMIIESISGQAHYKEARKRFDFDNRYPSMNMPPHESATTDLANLWIDTSSVGATQVDVEAIDLSMDAMFSAAGAAGAYVSVPADLAKWAYDLYGGEWLSSKTMNDLLTVQLPSINYGLGVIVATVPCGQEVSGHSGNIFYTTSTFYDPINEIAVSAHSNDSQRGGSAVELLVAELICEYSEFLATSTEELVAPEELFTVFPNPFSQDCQVQYELSTSNPVQIQLFDELGQLLISEQWAN